MFHVLKSAAISVCLLLALLHALFFLIEPGAPLRQRMAGQFQQRAAEESTEQRARWFKDAAGDGNLALHFRGFSADDPLLARYYFLGQYALYPRRVIVGHGDQVINSQSQIFAADLMPDDRWLKRNDVRAVMTIQVDPQGRLDVQTRPLH